MAKIIITAVEKSVTGRRIFRKGFIHILEKESPDDFDFDISSASNWAKHIKLMWPYYEKELPTKNREHYWLRVYLIGGGIKNLYKQEFTETFKKKQWNH